MPNLLPNSYFFSAFAHSHDDNGSVVAGAAVWLLLLEDSVCEYSLLLRY